VEREKKNAACWNTLGVALCRNGKWKEAIEALNKSAGIQGFSSYDGFFLAIATAQLGQRDEARRHYDRAVSWMRQFKPKDEELLLFRAEAAEILQVKDLDPSKPN
jgi:uncharacterized protein HemY